MSPVRRRAFTVMEVTIASGVTAVLAVLLSSVWAGLGRPTVDIIARCRLLQEIDLSMAALEGDLGGYLPTADGRLGSKQAGRLVGWMQPAQAQLWLCFDSGSDPNGVADWGSPDTIIVYRAEGDRLVRYNTSNNTSFTVARNLSGFQVAVAGSDLRITLTFSYRGVTRTCNLTTRIP